MENDVLTHSKCSINTKLSFLPFVFFLCCHSRTPGNHIEGEAGPVKSQVHLRPAQGRELAERSSWTTTERKCERSIIFSY